MEQDKGGTSVAAVRHRLSVKLIPGETTVVSWKKLAKEEEKADKRSSVLEVQSNSHPAVDSHIAPVEAQPSENGAEDLPPASRFNAVIEKIERLYMGNDSGDDDLNDVVDDDQYDTEDSFIDDAELDDYFQVDNSVIKHDGFFVNRGALERIEAPLLPQKQPKKRRRKDLANDDVDAPNKHVKLGKKASQIPFASAPVVALPSVHCKDWRFQNLMNDTTIIRDKKKVSDIRPLNNDHVSLYVPEGKDINKQKVGTQPLRHQKSFDKVSIKQPSFQGRSVHASDDKEQSTHRRDNDVIHDRLIVNGSPGKSPLPVVNDIQRREGSSMKPKSTVVDKAIRELEKMVEESARPSGEVQDADTSPAIKRRLPQEVKLQLAKVARLAQANHGKISKELVNRLMSIVGHLVQLRTLKRHLNIMVNMGLSAKKVKDDRFQQMKNEFREMVDSRVPHMKYKASEPQNVTSNDFRAIANMDDILEDKMCDLYDLYVEGLDEDAGPLVRKLYAELARLWPDGFMDNKGIKHGIIRAKDRKKLLYKKHKDHQENIKRKKVLTPNPKTQHKQQEHGLVSTNWPLTDSTTGMALDQQPVKDKLKGVMMKKVKERKEELAFGETNESYSNLDISKSPLHRN